MRGEIGSCQAGDGEPFEMSWNPYQQPTPCHENQVNQGAVRHLVESPTPVAAELPPTSSTRGGPGAVPPQAEGAEARAANPEWHSSTPYRRPIRDQAAFQDLPGVAA